MEKIRVLYPLLLTVTCLVCLGFTGGISSELDPLIKTYVSSSQLSNDDLVYYDEIHSITESEWDSLVIKSELPVMVMFLAQWCGPCRFMIPVLNKMESEYKNKFKFYKVDIDFEISLSQRYNIVSVPTTFVFKGGEELTKFSGANPTALRDLVEKYM